MEKILSKRNLILVFILFLSLGTFVNAQQHILEATFHKYPEGKVYFTKYFGERNYPVDSAITDKSGYLSFALKNSYETGMYRLILANGDGLDLIYDKEDIIVSTYFYALKDSLQIHASDQNRIYYDFLKYDGDNRLKLDLLSQLLDNYPDKNKFYEAALKEFAGAQQDRNGYIEKTASKNKEAFVSRLMMQQRTPFIEPSITDQEKLKFMQDHMLDYVNFGDTSLYNSNVFNKILISYLSLYSNRNFNQEQLENSFITAVDKIMTKAGQTPEGFEFVLDYLVGGFDKFNFTKVLEHLATNYRLDNSCEEENQSTLQKRLDSYKLLALGKKAPDLSITDVNGKTMLLSQINAEKIIVVFWASWCPHCMEFIPELYELYSSQENKTWEVVSISIDTEEDKWKNEINDKGEWINVCELLGWDSDAAEQYCVYATPTCFILDKNLNILAKPISINGVKANL
jgi:thiol-disulfide isomerase/thioredoxin